MASLATVVAVHLIGFAAMHSNMTNLSTPENKNKLQKLSVGQWTSGSQSCVSIRKLKANMAVDW